jgi:hypothetical protein
VTLGKSQYIIPMPEGNHRRKKRQSATPSQRWTKITDRFIIGRAYHATARCPRETDGTEVTDRFQLDDDACAPRGWPRTGARSGAQAI